jgi:hypothetical protein
MLAFGEIPCVRLRGAIVRFYLPDVVRHLTATALTRKTGRGVEVEREERRASEREEGLTAKNAKSTRRDTNFHE